MKKDIKKESTSALIVGAMGIVYGDIGTSPLYALKSCFSIAQMKPSPDVVFGIISLCLWALILVVSLKYVTFILKMDKNGEGGILILSSLASEFCGSKFRRFVVIAGILGTALFVGDGVITPAISVLSAVEGLAVLRPDLSHYVVPLTLVFLVLLFVFQRYGSGKIGQLFGPIMLVWFLVLFLLGSVQIYHYPLILKALNPFHGFLFLCNHSWIGFSVLGGVILVVTGAEALYADMGHFGRRPIEISWMYMAFPALIVNYLGQGALLLSNPEAVANPFYGMVPFWALTPMLILATMATIIASQAVISGVFSLIWQSILLNYLPRMKVINTSSRQRGQVYIPTVNYIMGFLTILAALQFNTSEKLAAAYGLCVAGIMLITTLLFFLRAKHHNKWNIFTLSVFFIPFLFLDCLFVFTNAIKIFEGAWYVILLTFIIYYIFYTWRKGSKIMAAQQVMVDSTVQDFIKTHLKKYPKRLPGTAIFLCRESFKIPSGLLIHVQHNKYLHEQIIFISVKMTEQAYEDPPQRYSLEPIMDGVIQAVGRFGFCEIPDLSRMIHWLKERKFFLHDDEFSIFLGRGIPVATRSNALKGVTEKVYIFLSSIAQNATDFYRIPHHRVLELGIRYKI